MSIPTVTVSHALVFAVALVMTAASPRALDDKPRPSVSVKANPAVGFAPTRIVLTAELKGGVNDYADYYCPAIEWKWGDDTRAESTADCEPYQAGKSEIKRRYVFDRVFQSPGEYRVEFRLKQKDKVVGAGSTTVRIRPGLRDDGGSLTPQ
ncbi:MAG TPA: hypothetical protein VNJ03_04290 [Vicinamibacterales bacterium]|nr:hypothetical protein [Vicinamibacterales bacterium]